MKWQIKSDDVTLDVFRIRPPFTRDSALAKVKVAENAWNSRDPQIVAQAYTEDSDWRSRTEFLKGRKAIKAFLKHQWETELDYRLMEELWCFSDNRISARFEYEWHDSNGQWYRTYGNEQWEFNGEGLVSRREMSANDCPIEEAERRYHW
jgi:nuclear transport factor 2 (NTF2) superfamily protein